MPDVVAGSRVRFNSTAVTADTRYRKFETDVTISENTIVSGSIDPSIVASLKFPSLEELRENHPQFDHIKVWKAPYAGNVNIESIAKLINDNNDSQNRNSFKLTIEKKVAGQNVNNNPGAIVLHTSQLDNFNEVKTINLYYNPNNNLNLAKGDVLFFRIHNLNNGFGGQVQWEPKITYITSPLSPLNQQDDNGKNINIYDASADFIMNNDGGIGINQDTAATIDFNLPTFSQNYFSDDVTFTIRQIRTAITTGNQEISIIGTANLGTAPSQIQIVLSPGTFRYEFQFYTTSTSNVAWEKINWKPKFTGNVSGLQYPPVNHTIYDNNVNQTKHWINANQFVNPTIDTPEDEEQPFLMVNHNLSDGFGFLDNLQPQEFPVKINWVTKEKLANGIVKVLHKRSIYVRKIGGNYTMFKDVNGNNILNPLTDTDFFTFNINKEKTRKLYNGGSIYSAFYVDKEITTSNNAVIRMELHPSQSAANYPAFSITTLNKPFFSTSTEFYGVPYRNWGQFLYNGGIKLTRDAEENITSTYIYGNNPIDLSLFNFEAQANANSDLIDREDTLTHDELPDGDTAIRYAFYTQDNENKKYVNKAIMVAEYGLNNSGMIASSIGRFGEANLFSIYIDPATITQTPPPGQFIGLKLRSQSKGTALSGNILSVQGTESRGVSDVLNQYIDMNGDSYPDIVSLHNIQFTNMLGALSDKIAHDVNFVSGDNNIDYTVGGSLAAIKPNSTDPAKTSSDNKTMTNASAGINASDGESYDGRQWVDMNGDGLPDKVLISGNNIEVWLNKGYGFTNKITWNTAPIPGELLTSERINVSGGLNFQFSPSWGAGLGIAISTANIRATLVDINGDQLPDLVTEELGKYVYRLNTGKEFNVGAIEFFEGNIEKDVTVSGNIYGAFTGGFPIPFLGIKVVFSPTGGVSANYSEKRATIQDLNGDGFNDILVKDNGNNSNANVSLNKIGKTHLLKQVNTPMGGYWEIDYLRQGNTYDMPHSKWVVNKIKTHDGFVADNDFKTDKTLTAICYENPKYDRREREFLGFERVKVKEQDPENEDTYRIAVTSYHNDNYYLSGAQKSTVLYTQSEQMLSEQQTLYNLLDPDNPVVNINANANTDFMQTSLLPNRVALLDKSRLFIAVAKVTSTSYENSQGLSLVKEYTNYDKYGNIKGFIDRGEGPADAYRTTIMYHTTVAGIENGVGFPHKISVYKQSDNQLLRERTAAYDLGKLRQIITKLNDAENNRINFSYDMYGNMINIESLDNLSRTGFSYVQNISYDPNVHTYPVSFNNAFGETSSIQYNYRFGIPVFTTDMNEQSMRTVIDNRGRIVEVTGPNELALGIAWTIRTEYKGESSTTGNYGNVEYMVAASGSFQATAPGAPGATEAQHYAVTNHFDPEYMSGGNSTVSTNSLTTVSIVDGFGQPIQVKKKHLSDGAVQSNGLVWMVGFEKKDAFGRTIKSFLPANQSYNANDKEYYDISESSLNSLAIMTYDEKDRVRSVQQRDEANDSEINYTVDGNRFVQQVTNEKDQTMNTFTDVRGRKRKTVQNGEITPTFNYNAINELIEVINNDGFVSKTLYDLAGRAVEIQHPDRGIVKMKYNKSGNVIEQTNSKLFFEGMSIQYKYNFHRLIGITYPQNPQNNVAYSYGRPNDAFSESQKAVGRLLTQSDATGVQIFGYGRMGEITSNLRSVAVAGYQSYWFYTRWKYDSWNRIQEIVYPDQEIVKYQYNWAGMLSSITGQVPGYPQQDIVSNIIYNEYGDRKSIEYGNGTKTQFAYDARQRMNNLTHNFTGLTISKEYTYDALSNITMIETAQPEGSLPGAGGIGGVVNHIYRYDRYNRIESAEGNYTGPGDTTTPYLRQMYELNMSYNTNHTINTKTQSQWQGEVVNYSDNALINESSVAKNSYSLAYSKYGEGVSRVAGNYGYQQPHAVHKIVEVAGGQSKTKEITYDANGNQTEIKEHAGSMVVSLRKNIWDEENRLMAVDLKPDERTGHPIAAYTYDAAGERTVRYNLDHLDISSNATEVGQKAKDNIMVYPSGLLMGKAVHAKGKSEERVDRFIYTKHYYIGAERVGAKTGTLVEMGLYPEQLLSQEMPDLPSITRTLSNQTVTAAGNSIISIYNKFALTPPVMDPMVEPILYADNHGPDTPDSYYFHPDHLGSSSYITNSAGTVSQHMEYLPFGETLVDEHVNSRNSPFKFNGKELDEETGNYYYGARYYDPKWSIFTSVDPMAEKTMDSYGYCYNNPINLVDPTGQAPIDPPKGRVLAVFYHGGPTGTGQIHKKATFNNSGYTANHYNSTADYAKSKGLDFKGAVIAPSAIEAPGVLTGMMFVKENYKEGDKVIIYGYSYGGDNAVNLSEHLEAMDIPVHSMFIIDSSDGPGHGLTVDTSIPNNVDTAYNFYQTNASGRSAKSGRNSDNPNSSENSSSDGSSNSPASRGYPHSSEGKSKVNNIQLQGKNMSHGQIQNLGNNNIQRRINERIDCINQ